jgi:hypothetical protein
MPTPFKLYFTASTITSLTTQAYADDTAATDSSPDYTVNYGPASSNTITFSNLFDGITISSNSTNGEINVGDTVQFNWTSNGSAKKATFKINDSFEVEYDTAVANSTDNGNTALFAKLGVNLNGSFNNLAALEINGVSAAMPLLKSANTATTPIVVNDVLSYISIGAHPSYAEGNIYDTIKTNFLTYKSNITITADIGTALTTYYTSNLEKFGFIVKYFLTQSDSSTFSSTDIDLYVNTTFSYADNGGTATKLIKFTKHV